MVCGVLTYGDGEQSFLSGRAPAPVHGYHMTWDYCPNPVQFSTFVLGIRRISSRGLALGVPFYVAYSEGITRSERSRRGRTRGRDLCIKYLVRSEQDSTIYRFAEDL